MKFTRACAGLGLAALLTLTAACGSDAEESKKTDDAKGSASAEKTTATPEGAAMLYMAAMADREIETLCGLVTDGEIAFNASEKDLAECIEGLEMLFTEDDEQSDEIRKEAAQALKDGPSKVEELTATTAEVSFAAVNDGEPTGLTKIGDEWLVNLYG